jgi:uncharacterized membrane protein
MKAIKILGVILLLSSGAEACIIKITPEKTSGVVGEEVKVLVSVRNIHFPCQLDINASEIVVNGAVITSQTDWKKKSAAEYEKSLVIKLTTSPKATISIKRTCDIKTSEGSYVIEVKSNSKPDFKNTKAELQKSSTNILNELGRLLILQKDLESLSQSEKDPKIKKEVLNLLGQLDSVIKYSKNFAHRCSLLLKVK